jgi:hypothetical protein
MPIQVRSMLSIIFTLLMGDACGIMVHYLSETNDLSKLGGNQICLLVLSSLLIAGVEAMERDLPTGDAEARCRYYMRIFVLSAFTTLLITCKPR